MRTIVQGAAGALLLVLVAAFAAKAQEARLDQMVDAALHGPELRKVKYVLHEFHIHKAKIIDRVTGITRIEGQISHYLLFRPDEQFHYVIEKQKGKITKVEFQIDREKLTPHTGKLAKQIPSESVAQRDLGAVLRKLTERLDGSWEAEAELIAYAIALRVDPLSHHDLVLMSKKSEKFDFLENRGVAQVNPAPFPGNSGKK
jgi:hypothetical protein